MLIRTMIAILLLVLTCTGVLVALEPVKPQIPNTAKKTEDVAFKYDLFDGEWGQKNGKRNTVRLIGNVKVTHEDTVLTCDELLWDRDAQIVTSPGKLKISDPECDITSDKGTAYLKKGIGVVEGNVTMLVKPKPSPEATDAPKESNESIRGKFSKPTTVACPKLEYNYRKKIASATEGVRMTQEKRQATANKLIYDSKLELITLLGGIKGVDEDGQTLSAPEKIEICAKKGAEWIKVYNGQSTIKVDLDEEE